MRFEVLIAVAMKIAVCWFNTVQSGRCVYRVIQEESALLWEMIV